MGLWCLCVGISSKSVSAPMSGLGYGVSYPGQASLPRSLGMPQAQMHGLPFGLFSGQPVLLVFVCFSMCVLSCRVCVCVRVRACVRACVRFALFMLCVLPRIFGLFAVQLVLLSLHSPRILCNFSSPTLFFPRLPLPCLMPPYRHIAVALDIPCRAVCLTRLASMGRGSLAARSRMGKASMSSSST